jgi:hypothetical protein
MTYVRYLNTGLISITVISIGVLIFLRDALLINVRNLPFDDGLFIGRAEALIGNTEKTLGSTRGFNPLVKGQVYPFILEIANYLNLNPLVLVYIIFLSAVILIFLILNKHAKDMILIFPFILLVLLDPSPFSSQASRISREFTYGILVLFLFAIIVKLKFSLSSGTAKMKFTHQLLFGTFLGLLIFLANNTREERIWIYLIIITGFAWVLNKNYDSSKSLTLITVSFLIAFYILTLNLKNYNENVFGVRLTSTTIEGEFPRLMSNLSSIQTVEKFNPYISISESKRKIAYENSPSFSLLAQYLEGEGKAWIQFGCENSQTCDDYSNGWFHVALRVAIDNLGYWNSQKDAQGYMEKVNSELENSCNSRQIVCARTLPLAKALGVTKISGDQMISSLKFLELYAKNSFLGWNRSPQEFGAHEVMEENQWERWSYVIKSLPDSQVQYENQFNNRVSKFNNLYGIWVTSFVITKLIATLFMIYIFYRYLRHRYEFRKNDTLLFSVAMYSLFIWFTRGVLLAINSATNFISISEHYALPGSVFLPISLSIFMYLGLKNILNKTNPKYLNNDAI